MGSKRAQTQRHYSPERVINGSHKEGVTREEEPRERESRVLRDGDLLRRAIELEEGRAGDHPLRHWRPEVDGAVNAGGSGAARRERRCGERNRTKCGENKRAESAGCVHVFFHPRSVGRVGRRCYSEEELPPVPVPAPPGKRKNKQRGMHEHKSTYNGPASAAARAEIGPRFAPTIALWSVGPPATQTAPAATTPAAFISTSLISSSFPPCPRLYSIARRS